MLSILFDEEKMFIEAIEEAKAEGRAKAEAKGRVNGAIEIMLDDGRPNEEIIKKLIKKFSLTEAEAWEKLSAYAQIVKTAPIGALNFSEYPIASDK